MTISRRLPFPLRKLVSNMRARTLSHGEFDQLVFGQQHVGTQQFFMNKYGQYHTIELPHFPHYIFLNEHLEEPFSKHIYAEYLECSWDYLYGQDNTRERRVEKIKSYISLYQSIARRDELNKRAFDFPIEVCPRRDGKLVIIHGNHRAAIALKLGLDINAITISPRKYLRNVAMVPQEFYGSARLDMPYQSIFNGEEELVRGRRPDVLERIRMIAECDLKEKAVLDLGCNVGSNCYLAAQAGAAAVVGVDNSPRLISAAVRLNSYFAAPCTFIVHDLNTELTDCEAAHTVICFSLAQHIPDKSGLVKTIINKTKNVLYFEGHANTSQSNYDYLLNGEFFSSIELLGYTRNGIHTNKRTRPLFRCQIS